MVRVDINKIVDDVVGCFKKVVECFKPFEPDVKTMNINYQQRKSEISLHIKVPSGLRRRMEPIKVPAYENFAISQILDESFNPIFPRLELVNQAYILDPSSLPPGESFLISMKGAITKEALNHLVRVQPAINRDHTDHVDRYWLSCMIKDQDIFMKMWKELSVQDVEMKVDVAIQRCFSTAVPPDLRKRLDAFDRWMKAGLGSNRDEVRRAWFNLRQTDKQKANEDADRFREIIDSLTESDKFREFIHADRPFMLGEVRRNERFAGLFPDKMFVEALTELSLRKPTATGYLSFRRKNYIDVIREALEKNGFRMKA